MQDEVKVREIETVAGDFLTEAGVPFYRVEIDGFCADFDYREAAENFANAINQMVARHRHQAERETLARMGWRPIETAPYDTPVEVKVGSMTFLARLLADASMSSLDETCDQWQAENDGEHPPCWSGGACWASNENEDMSLQPTAWRYPPAPEAGQ